LTASSRRCSGAYRLVLRTASGAPLAATDRRTRIVADSAPALEVPVPGADTTASPDARALIVIDARDDHGPASVVLELRRVSGLGAGDPVEQAVFPRRHARPRGPEHR
jgi:hypothetical protein